MNRHFRVLGVQVGTAKPIDIGGRGFVSAISKTPVAGRTRVFSLGLEGDEQADLSVHGGLSKAVYAYPSEHYEYWRHRKPIENESLALPFGSIGENLTLSGLLQNDVYVGDELHFGDCVLRVTQPRQPCFKFNAVMKDKLAGKRMAQTGFCGFYLSVATEGSIEVGECFKFVPGSRGTSIHSLFNVSKLKTRND